MRALPLLLLALVGCASSGDEAANDLGAEGPVIERLEPESGPAGEAYPLRLRIVGGPFDRESNTVHFGPVTIDDVPSADGTSLEVTVPKSVPSGSEVPPRVLQPGEYEVVVETAAGSSAPRVFVLTRG